MERCVIHLFGASGSGTSTLGRFIADRMDCFFMDTDDYYWQPTDPKYTTSRPIPERLELMQRDIAAHKRGDFRLPRGLGGTGLFRCLRWQFGWKRQQRCELPDFGQGKGHALAVGLTRMAICMRSTRNLFAGQPIMMRGTSICAARRCMTSGRSSLLVNL